MGLLQLMMGMKIGYSPQALEIFARMDTELPTNYKDAIAEFVDGQHDIGQLNNILECWLLSNDTQGNSLIGWRGVVDASTENSPTFNPLTGFNLNGTTQYLHSNFIPSVHAAGHADKLAIGAFIKQNFDTNNLRTLFGVTLPGGVGRFEITQAPSSAAINVFTANSSQIAVSEGPNDDKIFDSETEYTAVQLSGTGLMYKDGILISSAARVNNGLASIEITFGVQNNNGSKFQHMACNLCFAYVVDPTGFDFMAFHLGIRTMLQRLGVYSETPELTIPTGGEWFDFSQASPGNFASLLGRKGLLTALGLNTPTIESVSGVNMLRTNPTGLKAVDLASVFQAFYDGTLPSSFSILVTVKPTDGTPSAAQALFGHANGGSNMFTRIGTDGKITIGFKEPAQSEVTTVTNYEAFDPSPSNVTILIFEFLKDEMIVYVNGIKVNQTEASWGTRLLTEFDGGTRNMYLGSENVDGTITNVLDGQFGDFMIRRGGWSQSQKERLHTYFMDKFDIPLIYLFEMDGQSNMIVADTSITADLPSYYQGVQAGIKTYFKTTRTITDDGSWQDLQSGVNNIDPTLLPADFFGMDSKFAKDLQDAGKTVYIVKSARGGTHIAAHFNVAAEGIVTNDYYMTFALSKGAKDGILRITSIWMQGFQDCSSLADANAYAARLAELASDKRSYFRSKIFSAVEFDMVVCESPDFTGAPSVPAYVAIVQAAQLAFESTGRRNYSVSKPTTVTFTDGGGIHIDGQSVIRYSDKVLAKLNEIL